MIPIPAEYKALARLSSYIIVFVAGFVVCSYMADKEKLKATNKLQAVHIAALTDYTKRFENATAEFNKLQKTISTIDATYSEALNAQLDKNSDLRTDLDVAKRMRLTGTRCPAAAPATESSPAGSVGDGTEVVLSDETRQAVFNLRADLIRDGSKIDYLQAYIRNTCQPPLN